MLPSALLSKIDSYKIQFGDAEISVTAIDGDLSLFARKLNELKMSLRETRVVGLSYYVNSHRGDPCLVVCSKDRCVITNCISIGTKCMLKSMADESICVVGLTGYRVSRGYNRDEFGSEVKLGYLAARALKNSDIKSYELEKLAGKVGIKLEPKPVTNLKWENVMFFSQEEMKSAIYEAYYTCLVAEDILAKL